MEKINTDFNDQHGKVRLTIQQWACHALKWWSSLATQAAWCDLNVSLREASETWFSAATYKFTGKRKHSLSLTSWMCLWLFFYYGLMQILLDVCVLFLWNSYIWEQSNLCRRSHFKYPVQNNGHFAFVQNLCKFSLFRRSLQFFSYSLWIF